ncbi:spore germination protein [Metabacillus sp. B2-18]|uniref:spore germination protein n=1 Tax=Metabacillus sp. B2-18 TaxID=2897333 RepID=UPI001E6028CF|nr:spore germination protein [Metabacillus sp. B2-18]UGB30083.1 spore germination protein [Metabacillus sp. B2-18]
MPALVGPINLNRINDAAVFKVGDTFSLSPKSQSESSVGAGALNTGDYIEIENVFNITNFEDSDIVDQPSIFNF